MVDAIALAVLTQKIAAAALLAAPALLAADPRFRAMVRRESASLALVHLREQMRRLPSPEPHPEAA